MKMNYFVNSNSHFTFMYLSGLLLLSFPFFSFGNSVTHSATKTKPLIIIEDANRPSLSYDGKRVVAGPEIGLSEVYDVDTGKKLGIFRVKGSESEIISPDGKRIRIFSDFSHLTFDIDKGEKINNKTKWKKVQ